MALAFAGLTSGNTSGAGPYVTASVSPTAGDLLVIGFFVNGMGGEPATSVVPTGLTGTWTRRVHMDPGIPGWVYTCADWSGSGAITITPTGGTPDECVWSVVRVSGTAPVYVSGGSVFDPGVNTTTVTLSAFASALNQALGFMAQVGETGDITPGSGFTEIHDQAWSGAGGRFLSQYGAANDNTVDASVPGNETWACMAIEVGESAGESALTWLPTNVSVAGRRASVVASGMTPRGSGA